MRANLREWYSTDTVRASCPVHIVQEEIDNDSECHGDEREIIGLRFHAWESENESNGRCDQTTDGQKNPERQSRVNSKESRGIGSCCKRGCGGKIDNIGAADLPVEPQSKDREKPRIEENEDMIGLVLKQDGDGKNEENPIDDTRDLPVGKTFFNDPIQRGDSIDGNTQQNHCCKDSKD